VFFVLSGYLITSLLRREYTDTGRIDFAAFYARRFKRLAPALIVMLVVTSLAALVFFPGYDQSKQAAAARSAALWISNLYFPFSNLGYFDEGAEKNLFLHTWSLGVEEQFYLVWPALVVAALREGKLRTAMLAIFGISLAVCLWSSYTQATWAFYMMPTRAWQFALGALVVGRTLPRWAGWVGVAAIVGAAVSLTPAMTYPGALALIPAVGTALALCSAPAFLSARPMQYLGRISYGWYLWHWPAILFGESLLFDWSEPLRRILMVAVSLVLAVVSYHLIENPIRLATLQPRKVLTASVTAMFVLAAGATTWQHYWKEGEGGATFSRSIIYAQGCDDFYRDSKVKPCKFGDPKAEHVAVVIGDSIGLQWFPALQEIYTRPGWQLVVLTKSSCPMVDAPVFLHGIGRSFTECETWRPNAIAEVVRLDPEVLILGSSHTYQFTQEQWTDGTRRVLSALPSATRTIILRSTPVLPFNGPHCLGSFRASGCEAEVRDPVAEDVYRWIGIAAKEHGAAQVNLNDLVCPHGMCKAKRDGMAVFQDRQHLNAAFVTSLTDEVAARL